MCEKSPISILQEHFMKRGLLPQYTCGAVGSGGTGPFTTKVEVDGHTAVGDGSSKKQAKHNAAVAMLNVLGIENGLKRSAEDNQLQAEEQIPDLTKLDSPARSNFVGKLQEYMMRRKDGIPKYEMVGEEGPPHRKQFTMCCTVNDLKEFGTARTKQEAKNIAAEKILEKLKCDGGDSSEYERGKKRKLVDDEKFDERLKRFRSMMDAMGSSFAFTETAVKEYAVDKANNQDEFSKYEVQDRKMFSFLDTRSFTSVLPEKASLILSIDTGTDTRTIGGRGWTRRDAMYKTLRHGLEYLTQLNVKTEKTSDNLSESSPET